MRLLGLPVRRIAKRPSCHGKSAPLMAALFLSFFITCLVSDTNQLDTNQCDAYDTSLSNAHLVTVQPLTQVIPCNVCPKIMAIR